MSSSLRRRLALFPLLLLALGCDRRSEPFVDPAEEPPKLDRPVRVPGLENPAPRAQMPALRLANMAAYLEARARNARVMLLGEAPSHRGCRFSGIAFCSEVELVHKRDALVDELKRQALAARAASEQRA